LQLEQSRKSRKSWLKGFGLKRKAKYARNIRCGGRVAGSMPARYPRLNWYKTSRQELRGGDDGVAVGELAKVGVEGTLGE
jgi:hypothetical protein